MTDTERKRAQEIAVKWFPSTPWGNHSGLSACVDAMLTYGAEREQAAFAVAGRVCRKRAEKRFEESGITEPDTGATYYARSISDEYETRDEEDAACADAIERLAKRK